MASDMDHILSPERINTFQYQSPVTCIVWRGQNAYERIQLGTVCPFDTIDMLKRLVYNHYQEPSFLPRFIFMGIPDTAMEAMQNPTEDTQYLPVDFLWYPIGNNDPANTFHLANPVLGATDKRFLSQGLFSNPNYEERGRSTIEDVLIKPYGTIPVLHVFRFQDIRAVQAIQQKITPEEWYGKYIAYFPDIPFNSTYMPDAVDISFGRTITSYIEKRNGPLRQLERLLQQKSSEIKYSKLQTIQYIRLVWQRRIPTFDGSASLFYSIRASEKRPYIRLLPSQGIPITKLHVHGALPIPTVDDPRLLSVWTKETSPTPDKDACVIKYVHRPIMGTTQTIYGTIHVLNDGTMSLLLQPPQEMRGLDPAVDINNFARRLEEPFDGLPQPPNEFSIKDISLKLILDAAPGSKRFTDMRIRSRLPYFSDFFREIKKLPDDDAFIVLRYKAVSQYTSEDEYFQFITQVSTELKLEGEDLARTVVARIQATFVRTETEAQALFRKWLQRKGELMLLDPNEGEFAENNNSGIDIHIYAQHSGYHFQIHRISSIQTYERIYTLLSLLFMDKDEYFKETSDVVELKKAEDTMQKQSEIVAAAPKPVVPLMQKKRVLDIQAAIKQKLAAAAATKEAPLSMVADVSAVMTQPVEPAVKSYAPLATATAAAAAAPLFHAQQKMVNPASWFINKLEEIDKKLFTFTPPTGTKGYTSQCQANAGRQPVILTKELFERMREEYTDPDLFWIVYPLTKADKDPAPLDDDEVITVLRYGSNRNNINYIFCPEYYCLSCEIMVRKKDFEDIKERKRVTDPSEKVAERKPKNSCPFCHGSLITDSKRSVKGATVVYRKKTTNNKPQKYIQFIKNTNHPLGLSLPCCFSLSKPLRLHDVEFSKPDGIREQLQRTPAYISPVANEIDEDESDTESTTDEVVTGAINYKLRRERIHLDPILESNKNPYPGSAATAPPLFDTFFAQDSPKHIVTRPHINLKLRPNARGFVRMGTENSVYESLLGVLAPILEVNTISAVKQRIYQLVLPHIFINLHFGNLVLEFYNPADASSMPVSRYALAEWTSENLRITLDSSNFYELIRVYNAYNRYIKFIDNPSERKEMRHIQALLAEPGLLRQNGVQLIIMENQKDNIAIKCPVFGLARRHHTNDYVFVSKTMRNIADTNEVYPHYELYLYTDNKPAKGKDVEKHKTIIHWDIATHDKWPAIVRDRVTEYKKMCKSRYTTLYTSSPTIKPDLIIQLSTALNRLRNTVVGIVKDVHNHIIAVTLSGSIVPTSAKTLPNYESMGGVVAAASVKKGIKKIGATKQIALPIIDDGIITTNLSMKSVYLNWNQFITSSAPVEDVIRYYNDEITPVFVLFPGYQVQYVVKTPAGKVIAVQLQNSIYVPVANTKKPEKLQEIMEQYQIGYVMSNESDFQWNIDAQIDGKKDIDIDHMEWGNAIEQLMPDKRCGTEPDFIKQATHAEFEEQYQQFRYMVSNYITEPQIKQYLEKIIFTKNLPYYEKRQRLFIYLGSTLQSWFHEDDVWEGTTTFLRKDCRVSTKEGCTGSCYWKSADDEKNDSGEGQCLLHVKREVSLDGTDERLVSTSDLFIKRMIDELISFPHRREQLLRKGAISKVSKILKPIRDIDQYIIPESSLVWTELLRMEWLTKPFDRPAFYEELSREGDEEKLLGQLPKPLQAIFGAATPLQLYIPEEQQGETQFLSIASMINVPLASIHVEANAQTLERDNLIEYVRQTHKPIGFIDIDTDTIQFAKEADSTFRKVLVIVRINNQIGILLENNNDNYIMINLLPEQITDNWIIVDSQPAPAVYPEVRPKGLRKIGAPITAAVEAQAPVKRGLAKIGKPAVKAPLAPLAPEVVVPAVAPEVAPAVAPSVVPVSKGISKIKKINTLRRNTPSAAVNP